ncbi:MAG: glycosyltransferase family 2 protein [Kiritimatiellia bacterium]
MPENCTLTIVVPCYNEAPCIEAFVQEVLRVKIELPFHFLFVDDGSTDETLSIIKALSEKDSRIHFISFARNFGKESAIIAGLNKARGDLVVTMDVDLQDPPALLPKMITSILNEGYDSVATRRCSREGEPPIRSWFARRFYWLMRHFSDVDLVDGARDFRMMKRQVVEAINSMPEVNRFTKGIYQWVGFRTKWISFENIERQAGETKWSFWKLFKYSLEGITAFSTAPLQLASLLGILSCIGAFIFLLFIIVRALFFGDPVSGWPSLICVIVLFGGFQLFVIGILGNYLAKTYLETKRRPLYLIKEEK